MFFEDYNVKVKVDYIIVNVIFVDKNLEVIDHVFNDEKIEDEIILEDEKEMNISLVM